MRKSIAALQQQKKFYWSNLLCIVFNITIQNRHMWKLLQKNYFYSFFNEESSLEMSQIAK